MNTVAIKNTFTFKGISFWEFFFAFLGFSLLTILTLGLILPYFHFWTVRYFCSKMELGDKPVTFTGKLSEFYFPMLGLLLVTVITLGLAGFYLNYWVYKYFIENLEVGGEKLQYNKKLGPFFLAYLGFFMLSFIFSLVLLLLQNIFPDLELFLTILNILIGGLIGLIITFWVTRYFHTGLVWKEYKSVFNVRFMDFLLPSIGIILVSMITLGLGFIYAIYWVVVFFYTNTEFVQDPAGAYADSWKNEFLPSIWLAAGIIVSV